MTVRKRKDSVKREASRDDWNTSGGSVFAMKDLNGMNLRMEVIRDGDAFALSGYNEDTDRVYLLTEWIGED